MREYLVGKHDWKQNVPDLIWWKVHSSALSKLTNSEKVQIHKFMYNRLPTNHREQLYNNEMSGLCSECSTEIETQDHMIKCKSDSRQSIRDSLLTGAEEICKKNNVPSEMTNAFMSGLTAWIKNEKIPNIKTIVPNASIQLKKTYREQTLIGWDQIVKGRIATSWSQFINHKLDQNDEDNSQYTTSETWGVKIIVHLWKHILQLWHARNKTEHGETAKEKTDIRKEKLSKEVEKIKRKGQVLNDEDKKYIAIPTDEILKTTVSQMIAWIRNVKILQAIDTKKRHEECRTMNIQKYLIPTGRRDVQSRHHIPIRDPGLGYISV
jgi:hypothetical protein